MRTLNNLVVLFFDEGPCPHNYTVQPPQDIACNPYESGTIQMECAVTGLNLHKIQWYFSSTNVVNIFDDDVVEKITNSSKYTLHSVASTEMLRVILRIDNLDEENDTGSYFCRAFLMDGTMLHSPNAFQLKGREVYEGGFMCGADVVLKSAMSVCARPVPVVPATPDPLTTGILLLSTTTATTVMSSSSNGSTASTVSSSSRPSIPIPYIIIALVVFLACILVAILVFVICVMWNWIKNKGKNIIVVEGNILLCFIIADSNQGMEFGCIPNQ